jgi:hypothetical protein
VSMDLDMSEVGGLVKELLQINFVRLLVTHSPPRNCNDPSRTCFGSVCEPAPNPILDVIPTCVQNIVAHDINI